MQIFETLASLGNHDYRNQSFNYYNACRTFEMILENAFSVISFPCLIITPTKFPENVSMYKQVEKFKFWTRLNNSRKKVFLVFEVEEISNWSNKKRKLDVLWTENELK